MIRSRVWLLAGAATASLVTALLMQPMASQAGTAKRAPRSVSASVQVWDLNTDKLSKNDSRHDFRSYVDYITNGNFALPDIMTLQEVSSKGSRPCSVFTQYLNAKIGRADNPLYGCLATGRGPQKQWRGGSGIVFRADRFVVKKKLNFQIYDNDAAGGCAKKSTWHVKLANLADAWSSSRIVTVASLHLPTGPANQHDTAPDCTYKNLRLVSAKVTAMNRDRGLMAMAGDWNHADARTTFVHQHSTYAGWTRPYRCAVYALRASCPQGLGWNDPIYSYCAANPGAINLWDSCISPANLTHAKPGKPKGRDRMDVLLLKHIIGYNSGPTTVPQNVGRLPYSDHSGMGAWVNY